MLWKTSLEVCPFAGVWELRFQESSYHLTGKRSSLCLNCLCTVAYAKHVFPFWESGILDMLHNISRVLLQFIAGGIKRILCDSTERGLLEACTLFPQTSPICLLPLLILLCILLPPSTLAESRTTCWVMWVLLETLQTWEVVLEAPNTSAYTFRDCYVSLMITVFMRCPFISGNTLHLEIYFFWY